MNCDLCHRAIDVEAKRFAPSEVAAAVRAGLRPPGGAEFWPPVLGMTPEEQSARWAEQALAGVQEWLVCADCAARIDAGLPRTPAATGPANDAASVTGAEAAWPTAVLPVRELTPESGEAARPQLRAASLASNPAYPIQVARSATMPEARLRWRSALFGLAAGLLVSLALALLARKGSMLGHMFNLRSWQTAIPVAISCMFFWSAALCVLRWRRLQELERISARGLLTDAALYLKAEGLAGISQELAGDERQTSPLLRRLQSVTRQWIMRPSLQDADLVLQQHVVNDEEAVRSGYNLLRTFIWALPVLGLIGTVIGISVAVGGFAQFLGGNIEDIAEIKRNLVGVTGGLSFAFLITLQGLLAALLTMLAASALQAREEKFYAAIGQDISEVYLPALQQVAPEAAAAAQPFAAFDTAGIQDWRETLQRVAVGAAAAIQENSSQLMKEIAGREAVQREEAAQLIQVLRQETVSGAARLGEALGLVGRELAVTSEGFLERLAAVNGALEQQTGKINRLIEAQAEHSAQQRAELLAATAEQTQTLHLAGNALAGLSAATNEALARQEALQQAMRQLSETNLEHKFTALTEAVSRQAQETQALSQSMALAAQATNDMLAAQASLHTAMQQLHQSGFEQAMFSVRDSLVSVAPVLASFREPFVLQAIPATAGRDGRS